MREVEENIPNSPQLLIKRGNDDCTLLHTGGLGLQEIFYSIPGVQGSGAEDEKVYEIAVQKLDEYFALRNRVKYMNATYLN